MIRFIRKNPWILVVLAFILLISAWTTLFIVAGNNQPPPLETLTGESSEP